jgi:anti-anti-sigma regulatory factor
VLERAILGLRAGTPRLRAIILACEGVIGADSSACAALVALAGDLRQAGISLAVAGLRSVVEERLDRGGLADAIPPGLRFRSIDEAMNALRPSGQGLALLDGDGI